MKPRLAINSNKTHRLRLLAALPLIYAMSAPGADFPSKKLSPADSKAWTEQDFKNAKPRTYPTVPPTALPRNSQTPELTLPQTISKPGHRPTTKIEPDPSNRLYTPDPLPKSPAGSEPQSLINDVVPQDVGTAGAFFTSSRLSPLAADRRYPYAAVGKLFFETPQGSSVCSASVIQRRLVVTAGHCVHSGDGKNTGFYRRFQFVPAYRNGVAPFRAWTATDVSTTSAWFFGKGGVPNSGDWAILVIKDQVVGGKRQGIGDVVGWLGWSTFALYPNHLALVGYPAWFDNGELMHQVSSQSLDFDYRSNTVLYGSDMTGGSSGGPWIANLGAASVWTTGGQFPSLDGKATGGLEPFRNQVVAVTSYGPAPRNLAAMKLKYQGASVFDNSFSDLYSKLCGAAAGNCK